VDYAPALITKNCLWALAFLLEPLSLHIQRKLPHQIILKVNFQIIRVILRLEQQNSFFLVDLQIVIFISIVEEALLNDADSKLSRSERVVLHYARAMNMPSFGLWAVDITMNGLKHVEVVLSCL
jgi:hypothetical protein